MKQIAFILPAIFVGLLLFGQPAEKQASQDTTPTSSFCIGQQEAEKILGQPARLISNVSEQMGKLLRHKCTYTVINKSSPGLGSNLYYLVEKFDDIKAAQKSYADIVASNQNMPGQRNIDGLGDEAFLHTDGSNFELIMVRKQSTTLRIKVNKITQTTSLPNLEQVTKKIISTL